MGTHLRLMWSETIGSETKGAHRKGATVREKPVVSQTRGARRKDVEPQRLRIDQPEVCKAKKARECIFHVLSSAPDHVIVVFMETEREIQLGELEVCFVAFDDSNAWVESRRKPRSLCVVAMMS